DAQRDRLWAYCRINGLKIIDIKAYEGYSGSTLDRPGLQAALHNDQARSRTLIVSPLALARTGRPSYTVAPHAESPQTLRYDLPRDVLKGLARAFAVATAGRDLL